MELFGKGWWAKCQADQMIYIALTKSEFLILINPSDSMIRRATTILKPNHLQNSENLVGQNRKLVGQSSKLVGQPPHQLYRKLHLCWEGPVYQPEGRPRTVRRRRQSGPGTVCVQDEV